MTPIEAHAAEYLLWMRVHNYADTTIVCRRRYLGYFIRFCHQHEIEHADEVSFDLLQAYQQQLFEHRKRDGQPLTFATQTQRLVPVCHFFSWLRRSGRLTVNPASDLLMPMRVDFQDDVLRGQALREAAIRILAQQRGVKQPIHYRDWYELLHDLGVRAAGKDPVATFLTQINRSPVVERVEDFGERSGMYQLNPMRSYKEAQRELAEATQRLLLTQKAIAGARDFDDLERLRSNLQEAAQTVEKTQQRLENVLRERHALMHEQMNGIKRSHSNGSESNGVNGAPIRRAPAR